MQYVDVLAIAAEHTDNPEDTFRRWLSDRNTLNFLTLWEKQQNNPDYDVAAARVITAESGEPWYSLDPAKWARQTHATGIRMDDGRPLLHPALAADHLAWLTPEWRAGLLCHTDLAALFDEKR